jgi:hypothetical protein
VAMAASRHSGARRPTAPPAGQPPSSQPRIRTLEHNMNIPRPHSQLCRDGKAAGVRMRHSRGALRPWNIGRRSDIGF